MMRRLLRERTIEQSFAISTAILVAALIGATMFVVHSGVATTLRGQLLDRARSTARSVGAMSTPSLLAYNYAALQVAAEGAALDPGVAYVAIHDKEGNLAGIAGVAAERLRRQLAIARPATEVRIRDVDVQDARGETAAVLEVEVPVRVEGSAAPWGAVRVGVSYETVRGQLARLDLWLLLLGIALAAGGSLAGRWLARRITAPLKRLAEGTEALSAGQTDHRIPVSGAKELADLARAFNRMMDRVHDKARESEAFQRALEALNATLEEQVRERTRALTESEAQYKALVENSPDSILIVQEGRVRFMNRAFSETFRVDERDVLQPEFELGGLFDPSSAALAQGRIVAWERGEHRPPIEVLGKDTSGGVRHLELRGSRIEYRGRPAAECILVDTTEARKLRERLVDTERLRALGELSGGVAHDFNNLLGAILGRVQLLRRRAFESRIDRELSVIERAAQDGRETVRRIQEFARTRTGQNFSPVDLADVIRDALEITRTRWKTEADRRNVAIQLQLDTPSVPAVLGKDSELREVFTNLILNAIDAMPQGGKLRLSCSERGDAVLAEVADTGVGMTDEIRRHLFDPFFTTKGQSGTGLGLSVVYGIVSRHGGDIEVTSALGEGTTFLLSLPKAQESRVLTEVDLERGESVSRPGRILVIDDEPDIADVLREALVAEGHLVETALSGLDGVKKAKLADFDVVFTDLGMPDMSGWEVATQIRDHAPRIPVVLVTGWGATLDDDEVRRHAIAAVVHKPFDLSDLVHTTAVVLGRAQRADSGEPDAALG